MDEAMGDDAWYKLHGAHEVPKKYVPPFLQPTQGTKAVTDDRLDSIYALEIEENLRKDRD